MPYRDPARQRAAVREAAARWRSRQAAAAHPDQRSLPGIPAVEAAPLRQAPPERAMAGGINGPQLSAWAAAELVIPDPPRMGQPFVLDPWQRSFLCAAFAPGVKVAGLSCARKNGKTGLIAVPLLWSLLHLPRWRGLSVSLKSNIAAVLRDAITATAEASGLLDALNVVRYPPPGRIECPDLGSELTLLSSDKRGGHGSTADLAVIDETGLMDGNAEPLLLAVESACGARDGRVVHISVMGHGTYFRELKRRAERDPAVIWHHHAAEEGAALDDPEAWKAANPGLGTIKSRAYMERAARAAVLTPSRQPAFRVMELNLPGRPELRDMLVEAADWAGCQVADLPPRDGPPVIGLDFGGPAALTAAVAYWPRTGRVECVAAAGGIPDPERRGERDGVGNLYVTAEAAGDLLVYEGRQVVPAGRFLRDAAARFGLGRKRVRVVGDRFRTAEISDAVRDSRLRWSLSFRQRNWKDGTHAVRCLQSAVLERRLKHDGRSVLMERALAESVLKSDGSGNVCIEKASYAARIDLADALTLAVAEGEGLRRRPSRAPRVAVARGRA